MDVTNAKERPATSATYFDERWARNDDPWEHAVRWYETRKYRLTCAALPNERYRRCFEPASGAGVLTEMLAPRVDELVAMERHQRGVAATQHRCRDLSHVRVEQGTIPGDWPDGEFDLIVLSEVLYYLDREMLQRAIGRARASLGADGHLVAVHYRPDVDEHTWNGDEIHDWLASRTEWDPSMTVTDENFRLDVYSPSVGVHRA